jgi:hypothetical protein
LTSWDDDEMGRQDLVVREIQDGSVFEGRLRLGTFAGGLRRVGLR